MNLLPNEQQKEITQVVRAFLGEQLPVRRYQDAALRGVPYPADLWRQLVDLGWFGIGVEERAGGMGLGLGEEMLLAREAGRQLVSPTVLGTSIASHLLARNNQQGQCHELIDGSARAALALVSEVSLKNDSICAELSLLDADGATYLVACDRRRCFLVETAAVRETDPAECTDESLALQRGRLLEAPVVACSADSEMRQLYALFLVAALAGITEATRDAAVAYAGEREQFGQPIGAFQAISHLCADMAVQAAAAWAQCVYAALALENMAPDAPQAVASAAVIAEQAALHNARASVQVHGGVGFTVEYDAHYYVKRSHAYRQLLASCLDTLDELVPRRAQETGAVT